MHFVFIEWREKCIKIWVDVFLTQQANNENRDLGKSVLLLDDKKRLQIE